MVLPTSSHAANFYTHSMCSWVLFYFAFICFALLHTSSSSHHQDTSSPTPTSTHGEAREPHQPCVVFCGHHFPDFHPHRALPGLLHAIQAPGPQNRRQRHPDPFLLHLQRHRQLHLLSVRLRPQP